MKDGASRRTHSGKESSMKNVGKIALTIATIALATPAIAQTNTPPAPQPDATSPAMKAEIQAQKDHPGNPTNQNTTYPNQAKEQPDPAPAAKPRHVVHTGKRSKRLPITQQDEPNRVTVPPATTDNGPR